MEFADLYGLPALDKLRHGCHLYRPFDVRSLLFDTLSCFFRLVDYHLCIELPVQAILQIDQFRADDLPSVLNLYRHELLAQVQQGTPEKDTFAYLIPVRHLRVFEGISLDLVPDRLLVLHGACDFWVDSALRMGRVMVFEVARSEVQEPKQEVPQLLETELEAESAHFTTFDFAITLHFVVNAQRLPIAATCDVEQA